MSKLGAPAAFRGYRLQTIYILKTILEADNSYIYCPEGSEDLLIKDKDGKVIADIQVKARASRDLALSNLKIDKSDGFLKRICQYNGLKDNPDIMLISFDNVGSELEKAFIDNDISKKETIRRKLSQVEGMYSVDEQTYIIQNLSIEQVDENDTLNTVLSKIDDLATACSSITVFENLMFWLYNCSENQEEITYKQLVDRVINIGSIINSQMQYKTHWGSTIKNLTIDIEHDEEESSAYYDGSVTRYEDIANNNDIVRTKWLDRINNLFSESNVAILHGASGQGKTSIGYRFMHEHFAENHRFTLKDLAIETYKDVYDITQCIEGVAKNLEKIGQSIGFYIDVKPRQKKWIQLVQEVSNIKNVNILVSIREEDWVRARSDIEGFTFKDMLIDFDKNEALDFYELYQINNGIDISFEESWNRFEHGSLMEYVYMLRTGGESLIARLRNQINRLVDDEESEIFNILKYISYAASHHASVDTRKLSNYFPDNLQRSIDYLENEHLVSSTDDGTISGLHFIRSKIIADIILNMSTVNEFDVLTSSMTMLNENDITIFLTDLFYEDNHSENIISYILSNSNWVKSWHVAHGIIEAIIWSDINRYINLNRDLIKDTIKAYGDGWSLILGMNIINIESMDKITEDLNRIKAKMFGVPIERIEELHGIYKDSIVGKEDIFNNTNRILNAILEDELPLDRVIDWKGFSYICACKRYGVISIDLDGYKEKLQNIPNASDIESIEDLAEVIIGIYYVFKEDVDSYIEKNKDIMLERYRVLYDIVKIDETDEDIKIFKMFPVPTDDDYYSKTDSSSNNKAVVRALELLRQLIPNKDFYSSTGIGHDIVYKALEIGHDDTNKHISAKHFQDTRITLINRIYAGLGSNIVRNVTWNDFFSIEILEVRKINKYLQDIKNESNRYFKYDKYSSIYPCFVKIQEEFTQKNNGTMFSPLCDNYVYGYDDKEDNGILSKPQTGTFIRELNLLLGCISNIHKQLSNAMYCFVYDRKCNAKEMEILNRKNKVSKLRSNIRLVFFNINDGLERLKLTRKYLLDYFVMMDSKIKDEFLELLQQMESHFDNLYMTLLGIHHNYEVPYYQVINTSKNELEKLAQILWQEIEDGIKKFSTDEIDILITHDDIVTIELDIKDPMTLGQIFDKVPDVLIEIFSKFYDEYPFYYFRFSKNYIRLDIKILYKSHHLFLSGVSLNIDTLPISKSMNIQMGFAQYQLNHNLLDSHLSVKLLQDYAIGRFILSYLKVLAELEYDEIGIKIVKDNIADNKINDMAADYVNEVHEDIAAIVNVLASNDIKDYEYALELVDDIDEVINSLFKNVEYIIDDEFIQKYVSQDERVGLIALIFFILAIDLRI